MLKIYIKYEMNPKELEKELRKKNKLTYRLKGAFIN